MQRLAGQRNTAGGQIGDRRDRERRREHGGDRQRRPRPCRPSGDDEQQDPVRDGERTQMARRVDRARIAVRTDEVDRGQHQDLDPDHDEQHAWDPPARSAIGHRRERRDAPRQIVCRFGFAYAQLSADLLRGQPERGAVGATGDVRVDEPWVEFRLLAVDHRGDRVDESFARHVFLVVAHVSQVPTATRLAGAIASSRLTLVVANDPMRALVEAAREGDDVAVARLVRSTQDDVRRLCRILGSPGEVDDLVQETYLRAFGSLASFRGEAPVRAWLLTIARRVCADHVRRRQRDRRLLDRVCANTTSDERPGRSHTEDLLADLDPDRRDAFVLTQLLDLSYDEAALVLDCPIGTIRSRVARARADLLAGHRQANAV